MQKLGFSSSVINASRNKKTHQHRTSIVTNLRVSSAPAETRVEVSGERQVCNTLSV